MEKKIKLFRLSVEFGESIPNFEKIDRLIAETNRHLVAAKKEFAEFSRALGTVDGSVPLLRSTEELLVRTERTTVARRKLTSEEKAANKVARELARAGDLEALAMQRAQGSIKQMEAEIARLRLQYESLSQAERQSTRGQAMKAHLTGLRTQMRALRMETGDYTNNIGNYMSGLYNRATMMVAGIMGFVGTFKRLLSGLYAPFQELEYRMAMVRAVTRATGEEAELLEGNARQLGATTEYTATEVAGLQLAYARLGFVPEQITQITGATLDLATATGENLDRAADVVGTTLKGFRLEASETQRVVDVMTRSFNASSLRLDYFAESMKYVAPLAVKANVSLEQTTAMLGVLADRGIRGSQAGTALRRIFLEIAKDGGSVSERLDELSKKGLTLGGAMDEVGKYAMTALSVLVDSKSSVDDLTLSLENAEGAARKAAEGIRDTSKIGFDVLLSAVQEKLIAIGKWLSPFVWEVTRFLTWSVTNIRQITIAVGTYLLSLKALQIMSGKVLITETAYGKVLKVNMMHLRGATAATKLFAAVKLLLTGRIRAAGVAMRMFNRTLLSNPFGAVALLISGLIAAFVALRNKTDAAADAQKRFNDESEHFEDAQERKRHRIENLIRTIQDETETEFAKIRAYEELQRLSPILTDKYTQEQIATLKLADSAKLLNEQHDRENYDHLVSQVEKYTSSLKDLKAEREAILDAIKKNVRSLTVQEVSRLTKIETQIVIEEADLEKYRQSLKEAERIRAEAQEKLKPLKIRILEAEADVEQIRQAFDRTKEAFRAARDRWIEEHGSAVAMPFTFQVNMQELARQLAAAEKKLGELKKKPDRHAYEGGEGKWSLANDREHNEQLLALKRQLHSGEIASEQEYQDKVLELEIATLTRRIALNKETGTELLKLRQEMEDKQYKLAKRKQDQEKKFAEERKRIDDEATANEFANRENVINAMQDGISKKLAFLDLEKEKEIAAAKKGYDAELKTLTEQEKLYRNDKVKFRKIEEDKVRIKQMLADKLVRIVENNVQKVGQILKNASDQEINGLTNSVNQAIANASRAELKERLEDQEALTNQNIAQAQNTFALNMQLSDRLYGKERDRKNARREAAIQYRQDMATAYMTELRRRAQLGDMDSERFHELMDNVEQLGSELNNLGRGLNADGTGNFFIRLFGSKEAAKQAASYALDMTRSIVDAVTQIKMEASQRQLSITKDRIQQEYDAEVEKLEDKRKRGLISEKRYQKEMAKLDKEKQKKDREAEKKAFTQQKRLSLIQAITNTALAITNAFATMSWPAAPIAAATAAATGALQIAVIASQKYYRRGGVIEPINEKMGILRGPSHAQGGMPIYVGDRYVGEAEGDELLAIVNKRDTQTLGALSELNSRHGKRFGGGGVLTRSGVSAPVNYVGKTVDYVTHSELVEGYTRMMEFVEKQTDTINRRIDRIRVYVVQSDVAAANRQAEALKAQTTF